MLRRLYHSQPESFAFTPANQAWAEAQMTKFPEGRQASAVIPLLWRAQEQEGWVSKPAIEYIATMLDMAFIRVLEVTSFYFMFQMQPVGSVAHVQVCGTLSCMICGAEDLIKVCQDKIAPKAHALSADGKFSWEEVECLGSCSNAPMVQIGKDYYEDLTTESFAAILDELAAGNVPVPGPQNGRYAAEPLGGLTSLKAHDAGKAKHNASADLAVSIGDTIKRIDGTEVPLLTSWRGGASSKAKVPAEAPRPKSAVQQAKTQDAPQAQAADVEEKQPETLTAARDGGADDLKKISGVGPKLEELLNTLGFYHYDQVAAWTVDEIKWVDNRLKFKGRIERDNWMAQAAELAKG